MMNLSQLRAELAETNIDVLAPQAAFMVKGGGSSYHGNGSKKNKSRKKNKSGKKNSRGGGYNGGGWGGGYCGH